MVRKTFIVRAIAMAVVASLFHLAPVAAAEDENGEAASSPKSPIKVELVDYIKASEGPGTFKLAGIAIAGKPVYIYLDEKPIAQVMADESNGAWSAEEKIEIDDKVHTVRVEQIDETTNMMAARAQFRISLSPPTPEDLAAPPPGVE